MGAGASAGLCGPDRRIPLPARAAHLLAPRHGNRGPSNFAAWKQSGLLENYRLLFTRYVDNNHWDMLAILSFRRHADLARWRDVEAAHPAGLPAGALDLVNSISTYPASLARSTAPTDAPQQPVYLVIPYNFQVTPAVDLHYADDYVKPQLDGWRKEGILAGFGLYLQRYTAARPWDALLVLEYRDDEALGQREAIVAGVRQQLQQNPAWKAIADSKQNIRTEKEAIVADELR